MALPWVRLDTSFPRNHKLLALLQERDGYRAALVYICSLSYSGEQGTAGFITELALPFIHGRKSDAEKLVKHDFWQPCPGGWTVHDWKEHQGAGEEAEARKKRAQDAAEGAAATPAGRFFPGSTAGRRGFKHPRRGDRRYGT